MRKLIIVIVGVMSVVGLNQNAHADYLDILQNGGSIEEVVNALGELSYAGSRKPFWSYVRYLNYEAGESEGGRAYVVRRAAAEALGRIRDDRSITPLIERFKKEKNDSVRAGILYGLMFYPQAESSPLFAEGLSSQSEDVRFTALISIAACGRKDLVSKIKPLLESEKEETMKLSAAYALYMLGEEKSINRGKCIRGLASVDPSVRFRAADLIGRAKIDDAINDIVKAIEIENRYWVRIEMDRALTILYYERKRKREEADRALYGEDEPVTTGMVEVKKEDPGNDKKDKDRDTAKKKDSDSVK
jgi:hypothetical protein